MNIVPVPIRYNEGRITQKRKRAIYGMLEAGIGLLPRLKLKVLI
jgi:hypothetical protein